MTTINTSVSTRGRANLFQSAVIGALVSVILFVSCWLLALTPFDATHALIALYTAAEITSTTALLQGLCWSLIFGAWIGFLIAFVSRFVIKN